MRVLVLLLCVAISAWADQTSATRLQDLIQKAKLAERQNRLEDAAHSYREILQLRPHWTPAEFDLALIYHFQEKYPESISLLSEVIRHDASIPEAHLFLGLGYYETNHLPEALASLSTYLALEPDSKDIHLYLARTYYELHDYSHASLQYLKQIRIKPEDGDLYYQLIECYVGLASANRDLIMSNPAANYYSALIDAAASARRNDNESADKSLAQAIRMNNNAPEAWLMLGKYKEQRGRTEDARYDYDEALRREATNPPLLRGTVSAELQTVSDCNYRSALAAGYCFASKGDLLSATNSVLSAVPAAPSSGQAEYWALHIYLRLAEQALARLASLAPNSANLMRLYARDWAEGGRRDEADAEYQKAVAASDHDASLLVEYARFKSQDSHFDQAIPLLTRALKIDPADNKVQALLGEAYLLADDPAHAMPYFESALNADLSDEQSRIYLARCLQRAGRLREASAILEAAPSDPDGRIAYVLGTYYARLGEKEKATRAIEEFRRHRENTVIH